jgi:hypothetical protein
VNVSLDRLKKAFDEAVASVFPEIDYQALYTFQVVKQNGDGTLELQPVGRSATLKLPSKSNVPIRYGVPGAKITVGTDSQVLLGWRDGDPQQPFAALWVTGNSGDLVTIEIDAAQKITLNAPQVEIGSNATLAAARETDPVAIAPSMAATISAIIAALASPAYAPVVVPPPTDFGMIESGSSEVTIG